jgi:hypothetical protein
VTTHLATTMQHQIRGLTPGFFAEVSGLDLRRELDEPVVRTLCDAVDRYAVLVQSG